MTEKENQVKKFVFLKDYTSLDAHNVVTAGYSAEELYDLLNTDQKICNNASASGNIFILNEDALNAEDKEVRIVRQYNGSYMTQQYIGIIRHIKEDSDTTIFISSRFDQNKHCHFTNYLLEKALDIRAFIFPEMRPQADHDTALEKLLVIIFLRQINQAYKKGLFRQYRTYERNDSKIKGRIDIHRHIRLNPLFDGKIAYSYREYTVDNDVNRLILTAYELLVKKDQLFMQNMLTQFRDVKTCINQLKNTISPASRQEIPGLLNRTKKKITHSIYKEWEQVRQTAILLLKHMGVHITGDNTESEQIYGVLINIANLWERYLDRVFKENGLAAYTYQHSCRILTEPKNQYKIERTLKPDFYFTGKGQNPPVVIDAKYKKSWSEIFSTHRTDTEIREDIFQVLSYMYIFGCKKGGVICPCLTTDSPIIEKNLVKKQQSETRFFAHLNGTKFFVAPLIIPDGDSENTGDAESNNFEYEDFKKSIEKNEKDLVTRLPVN